MKQNLLWFKFKGGNRPIPLVTPRESQSYSGFSMKNTHLAAKLVHEPSKNGAASSFVLPALAERVG